MKGKIGGRLVQGFGINDATYSVQIKSLIGYKENGNPIQKIEWECPFYKRWTGMLYRAFSDNFKKKNVSYKNVTVCEEWKLFSNFKAWMEQQDWEGKELDKDLLFKGNKIYSPETCCFISKTINLFLLEERVNTGECKIGVYKVKNKYRAIISQRCVGGNKEHLGYFFTEDEAHEAWRVAKNEQAHILAKNISENAIKDALINRY